MQETIDSAMKEHFETTGDRPAQQPAMEMKDGEKWKKGDDVIIIPAVSDEEAKDIFKEWDAPRPYIRYVKDPSNK